MGSYAGQLNVGDRWRVALYVYNTFKAPTMSSAPATANAAPANTAAAPAKTEDKTNAK